MELPDLLYGDQILNSKINRPARRRTSKTQQIDEDQTTPFQCSTNCHVMFNYQAHRFIEIDQDRIVTKIHSKASSIRIHDEITAINGRCMEGQSAEEIAECFESCLQAKKRHVFKKSFTVGFRRLGEHGETEDYQCMVFIRCNQEVVCVTRTKLKVYIKTVSEESQPPFLRNKELKLETAIFRNSELNSFKFTLRRYDLESQGYTEFGTIMVAIWWNNSILQCNQSGSLDFVQKNHRNPPNSNQLFKLARDDNLRYTFESDLYPGCFITSSRESNAVFLRYQRPNLPTNCRFDIMRM